MTVGIRIIEGSLYVGAVKRISHKGTEYAEFAIKEKASHIWKLRAFGPICKQALAELSERDEALILVCEVKVDTKVHINDEPRSGFCQGFSFKDKKKQAKRRSKQWTERDTKQLQEYIKGNFEKGIVLARDLFGYTDWSKKERCVRAYDQWWNKIDFCMLMLGADKVCEILKSNRIEYSKTSDYPNVLEQLFGLAYGDYQAMQEPRQPGVQYKRKRDSNWVIPVYKNESQGGDLL